MLQTTLDDTRNEKSSNEPFEAIHVGKDGVLEDTGSAGNAKSDRAADSTISLKFALLADQNAELPL